MLAAAGLVYSHHIKDASKTGEMSRSKSKKRYGQRNTGWGVDVV